MTAARPLPHGVSNRVVPRSAQKSYILTAKQWATLKDVAERTLRGALATVRAADAKPLVDRELLVVLSDARWAPVELTDLGRCVYARLSAGSFCRACGRPLTFLVCVNRGVGDHVCLRCSRGGS